MCKISTVQGKVSLGRCKLIKEMDKFCNSMQNMQENALLPGKNHTPDKNFTSSLVVTLATNSPLNVTFCYLLRFFKLSGDSGHNVEISLG